MKQYAIPDFSKGLVDLDSQAKVDPGYKQKCAELKNFFIATDNTLKRRPPIIESTQYPEARNAIDFVNSEDRRMFLCNVSPDELNTLPGEVQGTLFPQGQTAEYRQTPDGLRATVNIEETVLTTLFKVRWDLKVNAQRLVVYDRATNDYLEDESYLFVTVYHDSSVNYLHRRVSLCAARAVLRDSNFPAALELSQIEEPAAFYIYKGATKLASSHTMPYKYPDQIKPPLKTTGDARYTTSELLRSVDIGQSEFLFTAKERCVSPIRELHRHITEGITFSFAGLRYRLAEGRLQELSGRKLLPGITDVTVTAMKTLFPSRPFESTVNLPTKVVYVPGQVERGANRGVFPYAKNNFKNAITTDVQTTTSNTGHTYALENLLQNTRVVGFDIDTFRGAHPELAAIVDPIKLVVSLYEANDGSQWMYPDIKYLSGSADISRVGSASFLYNQHGEHRTAVVTTSMRQVGWSGVNAEELSENSFPNGNGYAADGVGVCVALYKNIDDRPDFVDVTENPPDGFLYFFLDYDDADVQNYFQGVDLVSGFTAAYTKYRGFVAKKGSTAIQRPSKTFADTLTDDMLFYTGVGDSLGEKPAVTDFLSDASSVPGAKTALGWPIGLAPENIKSFATPCYVQTLNPFDATVTVNAINNKLGGTDLSSRSGTVPFRSTDVELIPYLHNPKFYTGANYRYESLPGRAAVFFANTLYLSQVLETEIFNNHVVDYFQSITNTTRDRNVLRASGLEGQFVAPIEGDPQTFRFKSRLGGRDDIVTVEGADRDNIFIGTENSIKRALPGSFLTNVLLSDTSNTGITSPIISESSYNIAAAGNKLVVLRYYQEAQGVVADLLAPETTVFDTVDGVTQLLSKHKLLFFYKQGTNRIFCGSMDKDRAYKGVSEFVLPVSVQTIKQVSPDSLGLILTDGRYCEMDFAITVDTDFRDELTGQKHLYESSVTSLPIVFVGEQSFSSARTLSITKASIGIAGFADFEFTVLDDLTGVEQSTNVRYVDSQNVGSPKRFGGFWSLETLPTNGAVSPKVKITKKDNKYIALSSVILEVQ